MRSSDLSRATWHKSSRSNDGGDGDCVEVAGLPGRVAMRDSKEPGGTVLAFTHAAWRVFLAGVRADELS